MTDNPNPELIKSDLARLDRMNDEDIDYSDIPELGDDSRAKHPAYVVINPLPPSRIEWLKQQSLRVAAVFQQSEAMTDDEFEEARRRGRALLRQALKNPKPPYRAKHADDPWLNAMLDDVHKRMSAMIEARGDGEFSREENLRYMRLVRELAEISTAMHDTKP